MKTRLAVCSLTASIFLAAGVGVGAAPSPDASPAPLNTKILKWKDGKKAVFMLEFDDSLPSSIKNVVPELKKRGIPGTFYINPGSSNFKKMKEEWATKIPGPGIEYGNHTFTHVGAKTAEELDEQLGKCQEELDQCFPNRKQPRLVSFGRPGGVPWTVTRPEVDAALAKYHLVERPPFFGYPLNIKTQEQVLALVDTALAKGQMGHHDFHGVGGDWLVTPVEVFLALLDKLEANREQLWLTDPVSWHKYSTERNSGEVKVLQADKDRIRIQLTSKTDPALYDMPLSLSTQVPTDWKECKIVQGATQTTAPVVNREVIYAALPGSDEISIQNIAKK